MTLRKYSQFILLALGLTATISLAGNTAKPTAEPTQKTKEAPSKTEATFKTDEKASKTTDKTANNEKDTPADNATKIIKISSGAVGGNYFVLGELVGSVISHPVGSLPCGEGGTCGIPGLQAINMTTAGSVSNLNQLREKVSETGFVQSDIAYWAHTSTGLYTNKEKMGELRAIASLYPEAMHVVVRKDSQITDISQLIDKRVSVGARKSGTLQSARLILSAYKLSEDDMETEYLNNHQAIEKLKAGELDAFFFTVGAPAPALEQLFNDSDEYLLLSIGKEQQKEIFKQGHYFSPYKIAENTYKNIPEIHTFSVYALWLTTTDADEKQIYELTKALWGKTAKQIFQISHIGRKIDVENSLKGIGIPLHSGAQKYYNEIGKRF